MAPAYHAGPAPAGNSKPSSKRTSTASLMSALSRGSRGSELADSANEWGVGTTLNDEPSTLSSPPSLSKSLPGQSGDRSRSATVSSVDIPRVMSPVSMSKGSVSRHQSTKSRVDVMPSMQEGVVSDLPDTRTRPRGLTESAVGYTPAVVPRKPSLPVPTSVFDPAFAPAPSLSAPARPTTRPTFPPGNASSPPDFRPILASGPSPGSSTASSSRSKPQLRLSTQELPPPTKEDKPPLSPGMKHWKQVRQHVLTAPSPIEPPKSKRGIVSRTAGRFGFRSVVENVLGYDRRRGSTYGAFPVDMTEEEREEASRERRRFARAVKTCLDDCAAEESARRLRRLAAAGGHTVPAPQTSKPKSTHHSAHGGRSGSVHSTNLLEDDGVSAFYPLLSALVKFGVDAKAKRVWSRTCPHHAAILAELETAFLPDSASRVGERAQALQVYFTIVSHWSTDSEDDELDRWLWLCRAMLLDDRPSRERGLHLLALMLRGDSSIPEALVRPASALDFESVVIALLKLLYALENSSYASDDHQAIVWDLLAFMGEGDIVAVEPESVLPFIDDDHLTIRNAEHELLWLAAAKAIAADRHVGIWLLDCNASVLRRFTPPPVLPGMPEFARKLRMLASKTFMSSFVALVRDVDDEDVLMAGAELAKEIFDEALALPERAGIEAAYALVLLALDCASDVQESRYAEELRSLLTEYKDIAPSVAVAFVSSFPAAQVMKATRAFLQTDMPLGRACIQPLLERLSTLPPSSEARAFLAWLATAHPKLFYKPLFTCAAAAHAESLAKPLRIAVALAEQLGSEAFWICADPQMIAIVLGDMSGGKGNGKAGSSFANVKLGRYALLVELIIALKGVKGPQLAVFAQGLETRLGAMLEHEERSGTLPPVYRSLVAQMIGTLRVGSGLIKRTSATRLAVQWYTSRTWRATAHAPETSQIDSLVRLYKPDPEAAAQNAPRVACLNLPLTDALPTLLVTVQASLGSEEWGALLPIVWERYARRGQPVDQLTFLLMKCAEAARGGLRNLVQTELYNAGPSVRSYALLKLAMLYGYRFQVYTQETITDKRGLNFRFPHRQLEFVVADMGSQAWVTPRDAQDAALQKYGRALPLELRQRLMELGWTEDEEMTANDIERMPVTAVPPTGKGSVAAELKHTTVPIVKRKGSNSSLHSNSAKVHRAVVPPDLVTIVIDQARQLATADDIGVELLSKELVRMFERDDATLFMRPVSEELPHDIGNALLRVNGVIAQPTPGFAHAALNALTGFLKTAVRKDPKFPHWAPLLGTIARLIPSVCEISLRDIRKTKSEHVLLPASIYETEGGFKLHRPWQEDVLLDVQAAQLILLSAMLRANPRDVYLVKKMLFNLQVQESMRYLPFARAWVELIVDLFTTVNSNYNDRAELRHFLYNITAVLTLHSSDMIVVAHGMRALALCATRFRRVFASIGFVSIMPPVYAVYVHGHGGIRDAVEYACRSFYRIHQDVFVYQLCLALSEHTHEDTFDARAAYNLLAVLSADDPASGVPSGIRDLNWKYEVEALLQMQVGGAEVSLSELRTDMAQEARLAHLSLQPALFPTDNIVRLLVTVIAVNAASKRGIRLMGLFAKLALHLQRSADAKGRGLLAEAIDVLGRFIQRMRASDDTFLQRLVPGDDAGGTDWHSARGAYVDLVDAFTASGGAISVNATRRFLDIVLQVLIDGRNASISRILGALARAHLSGESSFLADLVPAYRQRIASVDFSGVLEAISALIKQSSFRLPISTARLVVDDYIGPALRMLALASDESMAFVVPLRRATVELLSLAVFLPGVDALHALERVPVSAGLLAGVVLPLVLQLEPPPDREYAGLWVRILRLSLRPPRGPPLAQAAQAALALQIVKIAAVRVPDAISGERGLWTYLATYARSAVDGGSGHFFTRTTPRLIDWMMWSLFELLSLYRSPLALALRLRIQTALAAVSDERDANSSRPSTAGTSGSAHAPTPRSLSGLVRRPSARIPSSSSNLSPLAARVTSNTLAAVPENASTLSPGSPLLGSPNPSLGVSAPSTPTHHRSLSAASAASAASATSATSAMSGGSTYSDISLSSPNPSRAPNLSTAGSRRSLAPVKPFTTISARRASRPTFDAFERRFSAAPRPADRGTIVHLLGPASVAAATATGSGPAALALAAGDPRREALRSRLRSDVLADATRRGLLATLVVYGYEVEEEVEVHAWNAPDALYAITDQTRALVEDELSDVFNPPNRNRMSRADLDAATERAEEDDGTASKRSSYVHPWEENQDLPALSYTLNHGFEEGGYSLTTESPRNSLEPGHRRTPSREIPTVAISLA
ncbi:hypothetical protein CC85DRAFT_282197 [Cutaneotrichosporon oleaginosum]|uniref:Protein UNC80 C-terminal domain-containing protein n=1 Tax=Cutaneotrichosporon oleaginosum TaxID=879819 RepID=A0A0J1BDC5_9TREE|nr:uncharacterized protein CC85DRAFT_282197 [Cutaneotrichosporon oleaginosum]KLT46059.1 hypothetical protein CC85DRAFT_282197 [Cutaneotrichosporon oleaginosum]TXT06752.1 hypothetical protein COLE_06083 [Cutaneotrichosporon oleaginosum]